jgi:hypothetical protein
MQRLTFSKHALRSTGRLHVTCNVRSQQKFNWYFKFLFPSKLPNLGQLLLMSTSGQTVTTVSAHTLALLLCAPAPAHQPGEPECWQPSWTPARARPAGKRAITLARRAQSDSDTIAIIMPARPGPAGPGSPSRSCDKPESRHGSESIH